MSRHLHQWIDLIFGYKQRGEEAAKADNGSAVIKLSEWLNEFGIHNGVVDRTLNMDVMFEILVFPAVLCKTAYYQQLFARFLQMQSVSLQEHFVC